MNCDVAPHFVLSNQIKWTLCFTQGVSDGRMYLLVFQSTSVTHLQILPRTILFSVSGNREYNGNHFEALSLVQNKYLKESLCYQQLSATAKRSQIVQEGYWSLVLWRLERLSSSLIPAIRYFSPVIQVRASSPLEDTRSRDSMWSP